MKYENYDKVVDLISKIKHFEELLLVIEDENVVVKFEDNDTCYVKFNVNEEDRPFLIDDPLNAEAFKFKDKIISIYREEIETLKKECETL
jgi:hypothetical protein